MQRGMTEVAILCLAYDVECCWHIYDSNLGFFKNMFPVNTQKLHRLVSLSNLLPFFLLHSPPAVKCIQLPLSEQYFLPFIRYQHLKEHSNHTGNLQLIEAARSEKHLGFVELYIASTFCATATVNKQNNHEGE